MLFWPDLLANLVVVMVALLLAVLSSRGLLLNIEHFGLTIINTPGMPRLGHMSPITALCFLLASLSSLVTKLISPTKAWRANVAWVFASLLLAMSDLLILAYLFGTPLFYIGALIPPALTTSLAFVALAVAMLALAKPYAWQSLQLAESDRGIPLSFWIVYALLASGIIASGFFLSRGYVKHYRTEAEQQLLSVAKLKVAELVKWQGERIDDANILYKNPMISTLIGRYVINPQDREARHQLTDFLTKYINSRTYDKVELLTPHGVSLLSFPPDESSVSPLIVKNANEAVQSGQIVARDFIQQDDDTGRYFSMFIPIFDEANKNRALAVAYMRVDLTRYLYPVILQWPLPSKTAEAILVHRKANDVLCLNNPKRLNEGPEGYLISLTRTDIPEVMAVASRIAKTVKSMR